MDRRAFLLTSLAGALAAPLAAEAQQAAKVWRIGLLGTHSYSAHAKGVEALRAGLRDLGYVEGENIVIEYRWAEGKYDRLPDVVAELVALKVDVIVTAGGTPSALAAKHATSTIPIVVPLSQSVGCCIKRSTIGRECAANAMGISLGADAVGAVTGGDSLRAVRLLTELDAFYTEHRRCDELEAGVAEPVVWIGSSDRWSRETRDEAASAESFAGCRTPHARSAASHVRRCADIAAGEATQGTQCGDRRVRGGRSTTRGFLEVRHVLTQAGELRGWGSDHDVYLFSKCMEKRGYDVQGGTKGNGR